MILINPMKHRNAVWRLMSLQPRLDMEIDAFPLSVGREAGNGLQLFNETVSRSQFYLKRTENGVVYGNLSATNPGEVDGVFVPQEAALDPGAVHVIRIGDVTLLVGTDREAMAVRLVAMASEYYVVEARGSRIGPMSQAELLRRCENGEFEPETKIWCLSDSDNVMRMSDVIDFEDEGTPSSAVAESVSTASHRSVAAEEVRPEPGESFMCPYCRTVSDLGDVLSVSTSPSLQGDPVLGEFEQRRFLPTQFNANGLALDSEGGTCTEIACPRCHMSLPRTLLDTPQTVMSILGAAGTGKSVFIASSIWHCRQMLSRLFGVSFMDLDPVANRWINAYEEKLFFQEDDQSLQQIAKTDLQASDVSRYVTLDGERVLLPLPSFFQIRLRAEPQPISLVVYDSAGEHFRAGADTQASAVTLNMLNADVLFFMFDPSADPRFRTMLDRGKGTARNHAQRQDVLLAEMAARIRRHLGNKGESRLSRPLIIGVSKADLLHNHLPLDAELYAKTADGRHALDLDALRSVSAGAESLLDAVAPEVVATAHDIASEVWFVPVSALGHNPMSEGVRPCDIKPIWTELPVVFTLARKGLVPTIGSF